MHLPGISERVEAEGFVEYLSDPELAVDSLDLSIQGPLEQKCKIYSM